MINCTSETNYHLQLASHDVMRWFQVMPGYQTTLVNRVCQKIKTLYRQAYQQDAYMYVAIYQQYQAFNVKIDELNRVNETCKALLKQYSPITPTTTFLWEKRLVAENPLTHRFWALIQTLDRLLITAFQGKQQGVFSKESDFFIFKRSQCKQVVRILYDLLLIRLNYQSVISLQAVINNKPSYQAAQAQRGTLEKTLLANAIQATCTPALPTNTEKNYVAALTSK